MVQKQKRQLSQEIKHMDSEKNIFNNVRRWSGFENKLKDCIHEGKTLTLNMTNKITSNVKK